METLRKLRHIPTATIFPYVHPTKHEAISCGWCTLCLPTWSTNLMEHIVTVLHFNYAPHHNIIWESGSIAVCILDLNTSWRWVGCFTNGESSFYPLRRRLGDYINHYLSLLGYRFNDWRLRFYFQQGQSIHLQRIHTGSGASLASYPVGTRYKAARA